MAFEQVHSCTWTQSKKPGDLGGTPGAAEENVAQVAIAAVPPDAQYHPAGDSRRRSLPHLGQCRTTGGHTDHRRTSSHHRRSGFRQKVHPHACGENDGDYRGHVAYIRSTPTRVANKAKGKPHPALPAEILPCQLCAARQRQPWPDIVAKNGGNATCVAAACQAISCANAFNASQRYATAFSR